MKKNQLLQKLPLLVSLFLVSSFCFAQVTEEWVARYNGPGNGHDIANAVAVDAAGNVYVTGLSNRTGVLGLEGDDCLTVKYNSFGDVIWVARYNGPADRFDKGTAIALDAAGNVYVTGWSTGTSGTGDNTDFATIKYNGDGVEQWVARYEGVAKLHDRAESIAVDAAGNVYVTGYSGWSPSSGAAIDYATLKYNSAGIQQWVQRYNGPAGGSDAASSLKVDGSGNVYVTGGSNGIGTARDFATIKYNTAGILQWVARYNGPGNGGDYAASLSIDAAGNAYVTGSSVGVGSDYDYATVKYNATGTLLWVARYNGPGNEQDHPNSLAVDASGNVYVTGSSDAIAGPTFNNDYATVKYNKLGIQQWVRRYDGPSMAQDVANALVLDASGNVYVAGGSQNDPRWIDYTTIRYDATGALRWLMRYNGPGNDGDHARAVTVDASGNVYVTGESMSAAPFSFDYATIKYSQRAAAARSIVTQPAKMKLPAMFYVNNYPNPVSSTTKIQYELPLDGQVSVKVYDVLGREVGTLVNANMKAGYHSTDFKVSSFQHGMYYYTVTLNAANKVLAESRKIIVVK